VISERTDGTGTLHDTGNGAQERPLRHAGHAHHHDEDYWGSTGSGDRKTRNIVSDIPFHLCLNAFQFLRMFRYKRSLLIIYEQA